MSCIVVSDLFDVHRKEHAYLLTAVLLGEDVNGMSFQGADEELLRRALSILEDQGKCAIFKGETSQEDGIKFFG